MSDTPRLLSTLLASALLLLMTACGSSSSTGGPGSGELLVQNEVISADVVDRLVLTERATLRTFEVDVDLQPGDSHRFTELLTGFYDLDVFWVAGSTPDAYMNLFVDNGQTTVVNVSR